jgi:poly(glycerol-phosphate) alpha-glucosyltransferase
VFGISDEKSAVDSLAWQPLSVQTFRPRFRAWGYSNQLLPALLRADPDILSTHGLWKYCSVASHQWHRRSGRPYIVHPHGMLERWALQNAKWKKQIAALLYENTHLRDAACLRALCEAEAQSIRVYGMRNPVCIIPNGVDLPDLDGTPSAVVSAVFSGSPGYAQRISALGTAHATATGLRTFGGDRKILLYLGRLHPKKNLANLVRAWKQTLNSQRSTLNSWVLMIAGWDQGGYERELKKLASDYELTASVSFPGPLFGQEKEAVYRGCDAFILPSLSEGLPMAVLEAWAHAKPVLMTPECNLPEGFAADAAIQIGTTPEQIAAGLEQLIEMSDDDRRAMGDRGRTLVATKFSWLHIGEEMRSVFEWILGGGSTPDTVRL